MTITKLSGRVRKTLLVAALTVCGLVSAGSLLAGGDDEAIIAGTKKYLASEAYTAPVKIAVEKVEGDYARVLVTPRDGQTDAATVFLKREKGAWRGLTIGTGWDPEDLAKLHIPKSLQP
jgi:ABC-type sugar transport system substrate-binding protein